jgi:hypothetical protein
LSTIKVNTIENRTGSSITIGGSSTTSLNLASTITGGTLTNTPAFQIQLSANQSLSASSITTLQFDEKQFDTNTFFDTSTYTFTPTIAGRYYFYAYATIDELADTKLAQMFFYKDGSQITKAKTGLNAATSGGSSAPTLDIEFITYLNGSEGVNCRLVQYDTTSRNIRSDSSIFGGYKLIGA